MTSRLRVTVLYSATMLKMSPRNDVRRRRRAKPRDFGRPIFGRRYLDNNPRSTNDTSHYSVDKSRNYRSPMVDRSICAIVDAVSIVKTIQKIYLAIFTRRITSRHQDPFPNRIRL